MTNPQNSEEIHGSKHGVARVDILPAVNSSCRIKSCSVQAVEFAHFTIVADFAVTGSVRERGNAALAAFPSDASPRKAYSPVIPVRFECELSRSLSRERIYGNSC